jgi:hypothetical protein
MKSNLDLSGTLNQSVKKGMSLTNHDHYGESSKDNPNVQRKILICNVCYWSTSLTISDNKIASCPICHNYDLEAIPISINECYTFYYDLKKGLVLNFTKLQQNNNGRK